MQQIPDLELKLLLKEVKNRLLVGEDALRVAKLHCECDEHVATYEKFLSNNEYTISKLDHYLKQINA